MINARSIAVLAAAIIFVLSGCGGQQAFVDLDKGAAKVSIQKNCVTEMRFRSSVAYSDPYNDVSVDVLFDGPNSVFLWAPAFWRGDNVWAVRSGSGR